MRVCLQLQLLSTAHYSCVTTLLGRSYDETQTIHVSDDCPRPPERRTLVRPGSGRPLEHVDIANRTEPGPEEQGKRPSEEGPRCDGTLPECGGGERFGL